MQLTTSTQVQMLTTPNANTIDATPSENPSTQSAMLSPPIEIRTTPNLNANDPQVQKCKYNRTPRLMTKCKKKQKKI